MCAQGRVKCPKRKMSRLLEQLFPWAFDERSEPETRDHGFRGSARTLCVQGSRQRTGRGELWEKAY